MPDMGDITRRLLRQANEENAQLKERQAATARANAAARGRELDEARQLTREALAMLKKQNDGWQLVRLVGRGKERRVAGYPIATQEGVGQGGEYTVTTRVYLLENGRFAFGSSETKVEDLGSFYVITHALRKIVNG